MHKKALVTGGAGFIGSHLSKRLLNEGYEVVAIDNLFTGSKENIKDLLSNPKFSFVLHDITQPFWGQYDEIYNLACPASPVHYQHNPVETYKTSVVGMMNVLDLALKTKAKVLHASTSEVYGDPLVHPQPESYWGNVNTIGIRSCYDEGKRGVETLCHDYLHAYGVDVRMVRIFNTYGPNMHPQDGRVVSNFIMQALRGNDITVYGDGSQTRSFQYCDDLVNAMRKVMMMMDKNDLFSCMSKHKLSVPVFNVGNPGEYSIKQLADEVLKLVSFSKSKVIYKPLPSDDPKRRKPDISLAKEVLGWEPTIPLQVGLAKTIAYFKERFIDGNCN